MFSLLHRVVFVYGGLALLAILCVYLAGRYTQFGGGLAGIIDQAQEIAKDTPPEEVQELADASDPNTRASFDLNRFLKQPSGNSHILEMLSGLAGTVTLRNTFVALLLRKLLLSFLIGFFFFGIFCGFMGRVLFAPILSAIMMFCLYLVSGAFPLLGLALSVPVAPPLLALIVYALLVAYLGTLFGAEISERILLWRGIEVEK